jgi:hypothetical protein
MKTKKQIIREIIDGKMIDQLTPQEMLTLLPTHARVAPTALQNRQFELLRYWCANDLRFIAEKIAEKSVRYFDD